MKSSSRAGLLKQGILVFWSLWISIVVLMNLFDALKALGVLSASWKLTSGNYHAIVDATARYGTPHWLDFVLFAGVIGWESLGMVLFWVAVRRYRTGHVRRWRGVHLAFTTLLALFGAFILADELFHDYKVEGDHRGIAILLLASLLALHLLPDKIGNTFRSP